MGGSTEKWHSRHSFVWGSLASPAERRTEAQRSNGDDLSAQRLWNKQPVVLLSSPSSASRRTRYVPPENRGISSSLASKLKPAAARPRSASLAQHPSASIASDTAASQRESSYSLHHHGSTQGSGTAKRETAGRNKPGPQSFHPGSGTIDTSHLYAGHGNHHGDGIPERLSAQMRKEEFLREMGLSSSTAEVVQSHKPPGVQPVDSAGLPARSHSPAPQSSANYHLLAGVSQLPWRRRNSDSSAVGTSEPSGSIVRAQSSEQALSGLPQATGRSGVSCESHSHVSLPRTGVSYQPRQQHKKQGAIRTGLPRERTATGRTVVQHPNQVMSVHKGRAAIMAQLERAGKVQPGGSFAESDQKERRRRSGRAEIPRGQVTSRGQGQGSPHPQKQAEATEMCKMAAVIQAPLAILSAQEAGYPLHLQAVHALNGKLMEALSMLECEQMGASTAHESVLKTMLSMACSGEPHSFIAIKSLHFAAFSTEACKILVSLEALEQLLGMLRAAAGLEPELTYAALSLLATLSWAHQGDSMNPTSSKALITTAGRFLTHVASGVRRVAHQIVLSQLSYPQGLRAATGSKKLKAQLQQHLALETNMGEITEARQTLDYINCVQSFTTLPCKQASTNSTNG
mmetsp:Transcript_10850/g.30763  ORF Transcript_10850/g.30763 Transcript_10850/m.30763 type:complete len:628 (+) Transcript_10850:181-2064(+)